MGIQSRKKRSLNKGTWPNYSGSRVSGSKRIGPVIISSRGSYTVRLDEGLAFHGRQKKK